MSSQNKIFRASFEVIDDIGSVGCVKYICAKDEVEVTNIIKARHGRTAMIGSIDFISLASFEIKSGEEILLG